MRDARFRILGMSAVALLSVSSFVTAALLVFGLILMRTVLRLWTERSGLITGQA